MNLYHCPACHRPLSTASQSLHDATAALLVAKRIANRRPKSIENLKHYLTAFARGRESMAIDSVTHEHVEEWICQRHKAASGKATGLGRLSALFSFAVRRGWMPANPCSRVERITVEIAPPKILTVAQCRSLLGIVDSDLRPWVVLGLFAGLRPSEAERLDWSAVNLAERRIVVDAAASKTRRRRIVPLLAAACLWLSLDARPEGPVVSSHSTMRRRRREAAAECGIDWPQDVLRHSFGSYAIAAGHGVGTVSDWMGNSPRILLTHYRELVTPEQAGEFWKLAP